MATGATLASLPLPAYSISGASSVSLSSPPAVPLVAGGLVLVTPRSRRTTSSRRLPAQPPADLAGPKPWTGRPRGE
jgi:hypothetical protein